MKNRIAAVALVALLALTGCAGAEEGAETPSAQSERSAPAETAGPLTAETTQPAASDADEAFLTYVRDNLLPETQIPNATDEQLIEAGHEACAQLESGVAHEDVRVVDGEEPHENGTYYDSSAIMNGAVTAYCTDYL